MERHGASGSSTSLLYYCSANKDCWLILIHCMPLFIEPSNQYMAQASYKMKGLLIYLHLQACVLLELHFPSSAVLEAVVLFCIAAAGPWSCFSWQ